MRKRACSSPPRRRSCVVRSGRFPLAAGNARIVGSAGGVRGPRGVADWSGVASRRRIEPCVRFSRTRLSDIVHRLAHASVGFTVPVRRWTPSWVAHS
jgi:hypothetical protein